MTTGRFETITLDYDDPRLPANVRVFKPVVWRDETLYCVISGPNAQQGIFGCGESIEAALQDWNRRLEKKHSFTSAPLQVRNF